jgi:hypothetical protein
MLTAPERDERGNGASGSDTSMQRGSALAQAAMERTPLVAPRGTGTRTGRGARFGLRRFSLRGLAKVKIEGLWVALTFNVEQWIRLCWKPRQLQPQAV